MDEDRFASQSGRGHSDVFLHHQRCVGTAHGHAEVVSQRATDPGTGLHHRLALLRRRHAGARRILRQHWPAAGRAVHQLRGLLADGANQDPEGTAGRSPRRHSGGRGAGRKRGLPGLRGHGAQRYRCAVPGFNCYRGRPGRRRWQRRDFLLGPDRRDRTADRGRPERHPLLRRYRHQRRWRDAVLR